MSVALYPGRFQPFHLGHLECVLKMLSENEKVIVALRDTKIDKRNPFTINERVKIVYETLFSTGVDSSRFEIIKIPDVNPSWVNQLASAARFDIVYSGNRCLKEHFKGTKYKIIHLHRNHNSYSASRIRQALGKNQGISGLVDPKAESFILRCYEKKFSG